MFTSCCPAWVKFCEYFYPELLSNLSTSKSPISMQGAIIKTYFAKKLSEINGLPVVHMDNLYWNKDKESISYQELEAKLLPYLKEENWIIDGNYHDTLKQRLEYATDVFFLKMPREECI